MARFKLFIIGAVSLSLLGAPALVKAQPIARSGRYKILPAKRRTNAERTVLARLKPELLMELGQKRLGYHNYQHNLTLASIVFDVMHLVHNVHNNDRHRPKHLEKHLNLLRIVPVLAALDHDLRGWETKQTVQKFSQCFEDHFQYKAGLFSRFGATRTIKLIDSLSRETIKRLEHDAVTQPVVPETLLAAETDFNNGNHESPFNLVRFALNPEMAPDGMQNHLFDAGLALIARTEHPFSKSIAEHKNRAAWNQLNNTPAGYYEQKLKNLPEHFQELVLLMSPVMSALDIGSAPMTVLSPDLMLNILSGLQTEFATADKGAPSLAELITGSGPFWSKHTTGPDSKGPGFYGLDLEIAKRQLGNQPFELPQNLLNSIIYALPFPYYPKAFNANVRFVTDIGNHLEQTGLANRNTDLATIKWELRNVIGREVALRQQEFSWAKITK